MKSLRENLHASYRLANKQKLHDQFVESTLIAKKLKELTARK